MDQNNIKKIVTMVLYIKRSFNGFKIFREEWVEEGNDKKLIEVDKIIEVNTAEKAQKILGMLVNNMSIVLFLRIDTSGWGIEKKITFKFNDTSRIDYDKKI